MLNCFAGAAKSSRGDGGWMNRDEILREEDPSLSVFR